MKRIILFSILTLACILRLYRLGDVPISPDWDEVALGYNAFSILNTGKDEYGEFLPVILRSFDDYKPALYSYLIIPFISVFDLNVVAVRLPSVIMGVLSVIVIYLLINKLFVFNQSFYNTSNKNHKINFFSDKNYKDKIVIISLISAILMAISPWHLQFSRVAFESNVGLAFNLLMTLFFLYALNKPSYMVYSVLFGVLSLYTYQSEKVFTPLLFIGLIYIFRSSLKKFDVKYLSASIFIGILFITPLFIETLRNPDTLLRAKGVSIFSEKTTLLERNTERLIEADNKGDFVGLILNNRRIIYAKTFIANYISHFDLNWLFVEGDFNNNRHHAPFMGLFYLIEMPLLLIGIYKLMFGNFRYNAKALLIYWLLIAPLPASVTVGVPHAVRTLNMLPVLLVFIAIGYYSTYIWLTNLKSNLLIIKVIIISISVLLFILNFSYYLNQYFVQQNYEYALDWQYGYYELVEYIMPIRHNYDKIIISNNGVMDQSYMFFLFYTKYNPNSYLITGGTKTESTKPRVNSFAKFEFRSFEIGSEVKPGQKILLIGSDSELPDDNLLFKVNYPNGDIAIKVKEI